MRESRLERGAEVVEVALVGVWAWGEVVEEKYAMRGGLEGEVDVRGFRGS